jgi:6-phosphogluconolactonase
MAVLVDRRSVIAGASALVGASALAGTRGAGDRLFVCVGWIPGAAARGIYSARFDPRTGTIGTLVLQSDAPNPLYINLSPDGRRLYAGMSAAVTPGEHSKILAYAVDDLTLRPIGEADADGVGSRDPRVTPDMRHLLHVNYETGEVVCSRLGHDGAVGRTTSVMVESGSGPVRPRQQKPHPHGVRLSPGGGYVIVVDLGTDQHVVYRFDGRQGLLQPHGSAAAPPGSGPRHMAFHRGGRRLYSTNELGGGLNVLSWRERDGSLERLATIPTTPAGFVGKNTTADLALHPSGRFLYVSNRGHPSIAVFAIDGETGDLTSSGLVTAPDDYSWFMSMHPSGQWLVVSCRTAKALAVLPIDPLTGLPGPEAYRIGFPDPATVRFL